MALQCHAWNPPFVSMRPTRSVILRAPCNVRSNRQIRCVANASIQSQAEDNNKPSVVYKPTIWDYNFVESLRSGCVDETFRSRAKELTEDVRVMLNKEVEPLAQFKLIHVLQRLGLGHLFHKEIDRSLQAIYNDSNTDKWIKDDLYATALHFRLLRQHGYLLSQDVFSGFLDEKGKFQESLCDDTMGMLSLYEASYLGAEGESILNEARDFTKRHLEDIKDYRDSNLETQVKHSLEVPLHWRMLRAETRWFIDAYQGQEDLNPIILELAKLDFNMVQAVHQRDLGFASRWWKNLGLTTKLNFARDRLVESFLFSIGVTYEPQYERCRNWLTKVMNFVLIIDDIYDVHGSLEELELFTYAVERWEMVAMKELPDYMKISFLALFNTTNEMAYDILKEQGRDILPYLKKTWADFIKAMLVEAKWYQTRKTPSTEEYLKNGWVSSSGTIFLFHAFFATGQEINEEVLECLGSNPDLIFGPAMICRLSNDLATSSAELERGDVSSSIHCYMYEHKVSEQVARQYIRDRIMEIWKLMNKSITNSPFSSQFVQFCLNLARTSLCVYQYGDGLGAENSKSKNHVLSLIVKPITIGAL
ncbi:alpha-terpineol synthase, chloroplastic-like [Telopea speciosissima]|uniref:alpha-terpineol synthase, chloroplastic-like n=1 Tax=Telopea speciosissima TaxID=54955 RepID=UPI001CC7D89B|nr:alpha-terpineol synthase, chloroplastic-like [Telopea speciosissima]